MNGRSAFRDDNIVRANAFARIVKEWKFMSDQNCQQHCIRGIACNVENCIHNNHHCGCTANKIEVGPSFATTVNDTICRSFEEQKKSY